MKNQISDGIFYTGKSDADLRVFDVVMRTEYGTSYNSYVVRGHDKTAVVDTSKQRFTGEYIDALKEILDLGQIDYIVCNHLEPDHSGALSKLIELAPDAKVVCSMAAKGFIAGITNKNVDCLIVKDGMEIDLGGKTLRFILAPFLHWPDSIFTYVPENKTLFSGDVFGCHHNQNGLDAIPNAWEIASAQEYYFNGIMSPFKPYVLDALNKITDVPIDMLCPSHGPIMTGGAIDDIKRKYAQWAKPVVNVPKKVVIAYVSCYGYTAMLADSVCKAVKEAGLDCVKINLVDSGVDKATAQAQAADALIIGSPTINRDALPPVWDLLARIGYFSANGKSFAAFGSFGWSGEAVKNLEARAVQLGYKTIGTYRTKFLPDDTALNEACELGKNVAASLN